MSHPPRQLPLDLPVETPFEPEDFLVSPSNEAAYALIDSWPDWPDTVLVLTGPAASGKSHLAAIWEEKARAWTIAAKDLTLDRVPHLVSGGALVIEDCDAGTIDEHALFHLLNASRERKTFVLLTARKPPSDWGLATADLVSRLRLAPLAVIGEADDALLGAVLFKLFVDRQVVVDTSVIDYIKARIERSIGAARDVVAALDREGLVRGKRITRALAATLLRDTAD